MKKIFLLACAAGVLTMSACGLSAEEKAKMEQATADSIQAADDARKAAEEAAAAAAAVVTPDSTMNVAMDTMAKAK